uniref:NADH-ubiquinone oxidoreductase chain 6 n=1 Tax=Gloiopeltis furcata TaxID=42017 RepID=A0A5A4SEG7_9FLOR|nr:NADH dehydrogenase subunit 6 [Gloiopeltis furcata]BBK20778.1 NADH dehydrogenase subunit 6 [Gloiopeltis furcata]
MTTDILLFYFFATIAILSSLMVIILPNAVHSVLFLILVFFNVAGLLLLVGAEFLSLMLIIVYVGAIAVLFLFVVMMLNIKLIGTNISYASLFPAGSLIFFVLFAQFYTSVQELGPFADSSNSPSAVYWISESSVTTNIKVVGKTLYTQYSLLFLVCSLILLVAMIGAIVLTMHQRIDSKKQRIDLQLARSPSNVIKFVSLRGKK